MGEPNPPPFLFRGLILDAVTMNQAIDTLLSWSKGQELRVLSTPNANFLRLSQSDQELRRSILMSDLSTIDGMPLVVMARALGLDVPERVAGSDLVVALDQRLQKEGNALRAFFFGGREGAARSAHEKWQAKESGLVSCGWLNPGFGSVEQMSHEKLIRQINDAEADFIIVALGAQKGQSWILRNKHQLNARIISHLGAVVDFVAGGIKRSPRWVGNAGLEWLWRIKEEPVLSRRYMADAGIIFRDGFSIFGHRQTVSDNIGDSCAIETAIEENKGLVFSLKGAFGNRSQAAWENAIEWASLQPLTDMTAQIQLDCTQITSMDLIGQGIALRALSKLDGRFANIMLKNMPRKLATSLEANKFLDCLSLCQFDTAIG